MGYWQWWDMSVPDSVYLEFGGVQLYQKNEEMTKPPYSTIGLQFIGLHSVCFLTKDSTKTDEKWCKQLHQDQLEFPNCDHEHFSFTDEIQMKGTISCADRIEVVVGDNPNEKSFWQGNYRLVFWANNYGCAISADTLKLHSHGGEMRLEEVPLLYKEWWEYWRLYHDKRDTKNPMPKDYACEVTIPIKASK